MVFRAGRRDQIATDLTAKNRFKMPFLMTAERAARIIVNGVDSKRADITFPWQMRWLFRFVRPMPNWLWDRIVGGQAAKSAG